MRPCLGLTGYRCSQLTTQTRCPRCAHLFRRQQETSARRKAQKAATDPLYKAPAYKALKARLKAQPGICHLCGQPGATSVDHVVPISKGGTSDPSNLAPAHLKCNVSKGNKTK